MVSKLVVVWDESSVAAAGATHRPKPPHLNHTALVLGHLGAAWKHLLHSPCALEALTSPSKRERREEWNVQLYGRQAGSAVDDRKLTAGRPVVLSTIE